MCKQNVNSWNSQFNAAKFADALCKMIAEGCNINYGLIKKGMVATILGLHHQVKNGYMQNYLNEFYYKFKRRHFGENLFDRLVIAALETIW